MKHLVLFPILLGVCLGRPQAELTGRIVFESGNGEDLTGGCREGEVLFHGACYWRGERGPCGQGQVIWVNEDFPTPNCIPSGIISKIMNPAEKTVQDMNAPTKKTIKQTEVVRKQTGNKDIKSSEKITKPTKVLTKVNEGAIKQTENIREPEELVTKLEEVVSNEDEVEVTNLDEVTTKPTKLETKENLLETNIPKDDTIPEEKPNMDQGISVEFSVESLIEESGSGMEDDLVCHEQSQVLWKGDGLCYSLLTQGPCPPNHWLQLVSSSPIVKVECMARPCHEEDQVWWPKLCQCVSSSAESSSGYGARQICGKGAELLWSPYGEGMCGCAQDPPHEAGEDGVCHELGGRGPCEEGFIWKREDGGIAECVDGNVFRPRIFDLIPFNSGRIANVRNCHVDSRGRCRRRLRFNRRGRRQAQVTGSEFLQWIRSFERVSSGEECIAPLCENDSLPWVDGHCYQLNSQGPCDEDSWLLLESVVGEEAVMKCQVRECGEEEVWGSETCGCVAKGGRAVCGEGSKVVVSPTGDGICVKEVEDNICHVDQHGICHRTFRASSAQRGEFEEPSIQLQKEDFKQFLIWLDGFSNIPKPLCL